MTGVDDASVAKMSGGDVDVEPYLDSRNTKGYGTATQILKIKCDKKLGVGSGKWWCGLGYWKGLRKSVVV